LQTGGNIAVAETTSGKVRGLIRNGIYTYKGIPYATAKRFETPTRVESWEGIRSSLNYGPVAPLEDPDIPLNDEMKFFFDHDLGSQGEDCLALNIWTPSISDDKKRPVMFWIHGGGYKTGSSQELPSYLFARQIKTLYSNLVSNFPNRLLLFQFYNTTFRIGGFPR